MTDRKLTSLQHINISCQWCQFLPDDVVGDAQEAKWELKAPRLAWASEKQALQTKWQQSQTNSMLPLGSVALASCLPIPLGADWVERVSCSLN